MAEIYEKHNYLNKDISLLVNTFIREYDMKAGGFSILNRNNCLSKGEIDYLESCSKLERNIYLGNKLKQEPELMQIQMNGFIEARQLFFEANNIQDSSVLSIKKDAIFLIKDIPYVTEIDGLEFKLANTYNSYYYLDKNELYYSTKNNSIDLKGINDTNLELHKDYMLKELCTIFSLAERNNTSYLIKYLKRFRNKYLNKDLDIGCYRELNRESMFRLKYRIAGDPVLISDIDDKEEIEIIYNYINYIVPLISYYL